ncbi:MAG: phytoene/squalene synthase family protein [Cellulomonadaceae bacterium]
MSDPVYDAVATASAAQVIAGYSTSFGWACRLLTPSVRPDVRSVYALVRLADEIVDRPHPRDAATLLDALEAETMTAVATGHSTNLVVHAFAITARRNTIDRTLIAPFFASMRADLSIGEHDARSLERYIHGSAEVVGLMCLRVFVTDASRTDYDDLAPGAARLGAAFQKVNFLRDLAADHEGLGRSYFPGIDARSLTSADIERLCDDIDADLAASRPAIAALPANGRAAVRAAHDLFAELNARLRATSPAELSARRVSVPTLVKARILARGAASTALHRIGALGPASD